MRYTMNQNDFGNRNNIIKHIVHEINLCPCNFFCLVGKNGTGKKFVLEKVEDSLKDRFKIYKVVGDSIFEKQQKIFTHNLKFSFSLSNFIGLSLSPDKNENTKINYIISNLKSLSFKRNIVISATDYDILDPVSRDFLYVLINNKNAIESKLKRKITIIITSTYNFFEGKFTTNLIEFPDYSQEDLKNYLIQYLHYFEFEITPYKLSKLFSLCGTNLNLVNCYHKIIFNDCFTTDNSIEALVDQKLNYYIIAGQKYNLSKSVLRDIMYVSSMSVNLLFPKMISNIIHKSEDDINNSFSCAIEEYFFEKTNAGIYTLPNYSFISDDIKSFLLKTALCEYRTKLINYYNFLLHHIEDEYFERAQHLFNYFQSMNEYVLTLLILSLSKSFLTNDDITQRKINKFINDYADDKINKFFILIFESYSEYYAGNYKNTHELLKKPDYSSMNAVLAAELRRMLFKSGELGHCASKAEMRQLAEQLCNYIERELILVNLQEFEQKDEKMLSLRIIFDIAPYILDARNDKELFSKLYDRSLLIVKYIENNFIKKSFSHYVLNVFNRKAFLFAAPDVALLYYEEAASYFRQNKIIEQYTITLASKSGIDIALHNYDTAILEIEEALEIIKSNELQVQQIEKIYNNLYVAKFLNYEFNHISLSKIRGYALKIIKQLNNLLSSEANGKNHVILTNLASLSLYIDDEKEYFKYKSKLELSLKCKEVSNIDDHSINDFYRYHFAWYEFYRNLHHRNWEVCNHIIDKLTNFYPSIFHDINKMNARIESAKFLVDNQKLPNIREYCINFLKYSKSPVEDYESRGLLLSDLQFTSLD